MTEREAAWRGTACGLALLLALALAMPGASVDARVDPAVLDACERDRDRARIDLDDARVAFRALEEARTERPTTATPPWWGVLVRAEITQAFGVAWAEVGDTCTLALGLTSPLADCSATLHCTGRDFPSPSVDCDVGSPASFDPWSAPTLRYVWPRTDARPLAVHLDAAARSLVVRRVAHEPPIVAEVRSIASFELPR